MTNNFRMSYFMPPIAPIRNEQGQTVTPATLTPFCEVSVEQVYQMITCNENLKALTEQVRGAGDLRMAKASLLPYVTPCGTFIRRSSKFFASPSGLVVVDIRIGGKMNRVCCGAVNLSGMIHGEAVFKMNTTTSCGWFQTNPQNRWDL